MSAKSIGCLIPSDWPFDRHSTTGFIAFDKGVPYAACLDIVLVLFNRWEKPVAL